MTALVLMAPAMPVWGQTLAVLSVCAVILGAIAGRLPARARRVLVLALVAGLLASGIAWADSVTGDLVGLLCETCNNWICWWAVCYWL